MDKKLQDVSIEDINKLKEHLNSQKPIDVDDYLHTIVNNLAIRSRYYENKINTAIGDKEINKILNELTHDGFDHSVRVFPPIFFDCGINVKVGKNSFLNHCCHFQDHGGITIGENCYIGARCNFETLNHGIKPDQRKILHPKPIIIKNNVWVGANVTILQGVTIGENSIIAAGAVVTKDVEPNSIYAGVPAKFLKKVDK